MNRKGIHLQILSEEAKWLDQRYSVVNSVYPSSFQPARPKRDRAGQTERECERERVILKGQDNFKISTRTPFCLTVGRRTACLMAAPSRGLVVYRWLKHFQTGL
ncbi:unnamed protein product [Protopolystoma xenopodis]|uniref:Uncharacterized protein n=1 Tax=Protopolystoma xenopodis TaxID=117903 RepID=A0A448X392_9PLAT|nr:unnamed protein product [Protopolystoma xenopodis]